MSSFARISLVALPLSFFAFACSGAQSSAGDALGGDDAAVTTEALAVDEESTEIEGSMEEGVELGLSGGDPDEAEAGPGEDGLGGVDRAMPDKPRRFFRDPACIESTKVAPGHWRHVLSGCVGRHGRVAYTGTVDSKWSADEAAKKLTVVHSAQGFEAKGPNVTFTASGSRTVTYARTEGGATRERRGSWTGTVTRDESGKSKTWSHEASFTSTWDRATKCVTRDGSAENTVGDRSFGRVVDGYKRCGVGAFGCPDAGKVTLDRKDGRAIAVTYLGGGKLRVERGERAVEAKLRFCRAD